MNCLPRSGVRRFLGVLALGTFTLAVLATFDAAASASGTTTGSLLTSTRSTIAHQSGVHVVFTAHSDSPSRTEKIIADVGETSGRETVTEGSAHVSIRVTPTFAYVSGNSSGLTSLFGMSATDAKKVGRAWESWKAGTKQYSNLKADLTMTSVTALLPKAKGSSLATTTSGGAKLYILSWTSPATASVPKLSNTITISASGATLPITQTATATGGTKIKTTLSRWGEDVLVQPPPITATISSSKVTG